MEEDEPNKKKQQGSDEWEWLGDQTRVYSTRSAYNLILETSKGGRDEDIVCEGDMRSREHLKPQMHHTTKAPKFYIWVRFRS